MQMKNEKGNNATITPLKLVIKLDPIQLGVLYTTDPQRKRKRLYLVDLQHLLMLGDAQRITEAIFAQHPTIFKPDRVPFEQVCNLLQKMMEFIQNEIMEDDDAPGSEDGPPVPQRTATLAYQRK